MTDHDERLSRRYRELARDEPPPAVDAAILAAATRAAQSRPRRNWAGPVSIAAVLVLGIGVSLRMQLEQPGIETSVPRSEQYAPQATPSAPADITTQPSESQAREPLPGPLSREREQTAPAAKRKLVPEQKSMAQDKAVAAPSRTAPAAVAAPEARPFADSIAPASPPPAKHASPPPALAAPAAPSMQAAPARNMAPAAQPASEAAAPAAPPTAAVAAPAGAPVTPERAKREAAGSAESRALLKSFASDRTAELDRIARLRAEGRDAEADKALEEFQRRYPDYRIPEGVWERVKPR